MYNFTATDSTEMAQQVYQMMDRVGVGSGSRNGPVLKFNGPIMTTYTNPWQRANFTPGRDANPFFHIAEAMWMLAGRQDVQFLDYFNSGMKQYSDDGEIFNAAYGYRARKHFGFDQLQTAVDVLNVDHNSRQAVVQLWSPHDLIKDTKDKACNMSMVFSIRDIFLDLMVYNRSNDLVYGGVTGANPVHFSYFQQWVADQLGMPMGHLSFTSTNAHVYTTLYPHWERMDYYAKLIPPRAIELPLGSFDEIEHLCKLIEKKDFIGHKFDSLHLELIVKPLMNAWICRKEELEHNPYWLVECCQCPALSLAARLWLEARNKNGH